MSVPLADILSTPGLNGIYRFAAPAGSLPTLDGRATADKAGLLAALGWALECPDYYGANWDALEECLGDMSWRPGPIVLRIAHAEALPTDVLETLLEIFADAAQSWREAGRVCSLFVSGLDRTDLPLAE